MKKLKSEIGDLEKHVSELSVESDKRRSELLNFTNLELPEPLIIQTATGEKVLRTVGEILMHGNGLLASALKAKDNVARAHEDLERLNIREAREKKP